jgi:hypothetical protein
MSTTAVGHCDRYAAVVNRHWPSCLVCHAALPATSREAGSPAISVQPGDRITWQGSEGQPNVGVIDFLHAYPGEVWAFCILPDDTWCAVNVKYCTKSEPS